MRQKVFNLFLSVYFYVFVIGISLVFMPIAFCVWLCTVLFDRRLKALHYFTSFWGSLFVWINPYWDVEIQNLECFEKNKTYVVVSNHQSAVDIIVLYRLFRYFKWVSKAENFKVPIIGWVMKLNKYVKIKRGDAKSAAKMICDCEDAIRNGASIMIFPEGTRSETLKMRRFKDGAFHIAKDTEVGILPVVIDGSGRAIPKRGFVLQGRQQIKVKVLKEIPVSEVKRLSVKDLRVDVQAKMEAELQLMNEIKYEEQSQGVLC
jgi:1-acyl-sn-glycerol-3-phosphate acyltransferase